MRVMASSFLKFLDHTQRRTTAGRTPLDEWSGRGRDLYLTAHNTQNRQTSMPLVEFELTISAGERPQTSALDRAATGNGRGNDTARETPKYSVTNLSHIHFVYHKSHTDWPGIEPELPVCEAGKQPPEPRHGINLKLKINPRCS